MKRTRIVLGLFILALCLPMAPLAPGQESARPDDEATAEEKPSRTSPLGVRQLRVKRMMQEMELKFRRVAAALEKAGETERAEKLVEALQNSKQMLIENRMEDIVKMLNEQQLESATTEQKEVITDLKKDGTIAKIYETWFGTAPDAGTTTVDVVDMPKAK